MARKAFRQLSASNEVARDGDSRFYYGWVIVAACGVLLGSMAAIMYSYGVFFKHFIADFGWSRAATSGVYSVIHICWGFVSIAAGLLVDRFGPARVMAISIFIGGVGLVLTSQITALWQLYLTLGVITGIGFGAIYPATIATTARWFTKRRGLALGLVASGVGIGNMILIPSIERLIANFGWSTTYLILGIFTITILLPCSIILRRSPPGIHPAYQESGDASARSVDQEGAKQTISDISSVVKAAASHRPLWMLALIYFSFVFCLQLVMVHLVNYATDIGISSFMAATFISFLGFASFFGRIIMGAWSDRIGSNNVIITCGVLLFASLIFLLFTREPWAFYLFAVTFGFSYGGEVPQMPVLVGRYYGLRTVASLVGIIAGLAGIGGAAGAWMAGRIFDATQSYQVAFIVAILVSLASTIIMVMLKRVKPVTPD